MPLNIPGLLVPFQLLWNPRIALPHLVVADIRQIDFQALKKAGYKGAIFDKDNCLTIPHRDTLVPELQDSWQECREVFGEGNVLIVSNSAGTALDAGGIQAESLTHHLQTPVLQHTSLKPSYRCIKGIRAYFASLKTTPKDSELIVVGDRIFTDVVLANRMHTRLQFPANAPQQKRTGPLAIWTTAVWQKESMLMRWGERKLVQAVEKWSMDVDSETREDAQKFVKQPQEKEAKADEKKGLGGWLLRSLGRT